jgi:hypothetical protein
MPIIQASGTQAASIGVEQTLADLTSPFAIYQLIVNVNAMQAGDVTDLRIYTKVLSGDMIGNCSALFQQISGAPTGYGDQVYLSLPVVSDQEIKFTLQQIAGSPRSYPWKAVSF